MFSSNASQVSDSATYIEDVFSTYLYTGNGSTQTITNGIDLAGEGGLVWLKQRDLALDHLLMDSARGATNYLSSNTTSGQNAGAPVTFTSIGLSIASGGAFWNQSSNKYASWTFRKQPKFFDVVTYTGNGATQNIAHSLGSVPGSIIVKRTNDTANWQVYHRSLANTECLVLNSTSGIVTSATRWNSTTPTSTVFSVGNDSNVNASGSTYVAYLFAHNAGGFGESGEDNVISCGSYTQSGGVDTVNLGYEPQWFLRKRVDGTSNWTLLDTMRGWSTDTSTDAALSANTTSAESLTDVGRPTATGMEFDAGAAGVTYIYIAIRRGPMKVPESGTSVFNPVAYTGTNVDNRLVNTGIVTDMTMARIRTATSTGGFYTADRLRANASLGTATTDVENTDVDSFMTPTLGYGNSFSAMNGFGVGNDAARQLNQSSTAQLAYAFARAPSFFDEVCDTGAGGAHTITHNLQAVPELMIRRGRNQAGANWFVYAGNLGYTKYGLLNATNTFNTNSVFWHADPTSTVFSVGDNGVGINDTGITYVTYLFASCPGVSKVGSYTGTATTQQINCGFTGGARFVLIKRTDSTGDWYVWDSARGIVAGNDPYLLLNSTAAEVTSTDYVDTYSAGFEISSTAPAAINASGGTFIFLAIA